MVCFACYMAFGVLRSAVLALVLKESLSHYFYSYWACELVSAVLAILVTRELGNLLLNDVPEWKKLGRCGFQWTAAMLVIISVLFSDPAMDAGSIQITRLVLGFERSIRFVQCGLLISMIAFCETLKVNWKNQVFGAMLGFAVIATSNLVLSTLHLHFGEVLSQVLQLLKPLSYLVATLIWVIYVWIPLSSVSPRVSANAETMVVLNNWRTQLAEVRLP